MLHATGFKGCLSDERILAILLVDYSVSLVKISDQLTIMLYYWQIKFMMQFKKSECPNVEFFFSS
jgi:hypothetical protein